jgi:altronate hydrolase
VSADRKALRIHPADSVAVAVEALAKGTEVAVGGERLRLVTDVPAGHKFSLRPIARGETVLKYGFPIGSATADIPKGAQVHSHNLATLLEEKAEYRWKGEAGAQKKIESATIQAYWRADGQVGVRNELWIVPTVGCVNRPAEKLAEWARDEFAGKLDGAYAWSHPYGCSQLGGDHAATRTILADLVRHPNAGGVLVLGLGCENNTIEEFKKALGDYDGERVKFLVCQEVPDEIEAGKELLAELASHAAMARRESLPVSELVIGMKCGGSDGFSGITANPLVGRLSDLVVRMGGSTILTEVPEMFGAETILMGRCATREAFDKSVALINGFKEYFTRHGQVVYENPSPGNKAGGITTLEEKSLGCVQKGGSSPVSGVLAYGERLGRKGLNLLEGPGNDIVSTTALTAAGAQLILFTTGRGTPLGAPVPTLKVSSNSALAAGKPGWIDFDAGRLLDADAEPEALLSEFFQLVRDTASGVYRTANERNDYREIAIFKDGVTL